MIPDFLPPPRQVLTLEHMTTGIVQESARERGTRDDMSTKTFGHVWVQIPAACVAGERFIHCST